MAEERAWIQRHLVVRIRRGATSSACPASKDRSADRHGWSNRTPAYCIDVPAQVSAAAQALESVALSLLNEHLTHCAKGGNVAEQKSGKPRRPHRLARSLLKQQSF